jgi:hypothetical protein
MTDPTMSYVPLHVRYVATGDPTGDYVATCNCGWTGEPQDEVLAAQIDAADHRDGAAGTPDALDQAITDLLDLGDDLADTVIWLAEHWSADLPSPHPTATSHTIGIDAKAGLRLLVYCADSTEFSRAAQLLGAPVTVDSEPNPFGDYYRRAVRCIGRVHIHAYALAGERSW